VTFGYRNDGCGPARAVCGGSHANCGDRPIQALLGVPLSRCRRIPGRPANRRLPIRHQSADVCARTFAASVVRLAAIKRERKAMTSG
jgi:hypothetical protein